MSDVFDIEYKEFQNAFLKYKDQRIILYGIGRRTATLISHNQCFDFVGLMDRDSDNLGKKMYGLPIISLEQAEKQGDIIIINAPRTYWKIIYKRISNSKIPVYFFNGEAAKIETVKFSNDIPYWKENWENFGKKIDVYKIILFDIFDVLLTKRILNWEDIYDLININLHNEGILNEQYNLTEMRNKALKNMNSIVANFDSLYIEIQKIYSLSNQMIEQMKKMEIKIVKKIIKPRYKMVDKYKKMLKDDKDIFLISDGYYVKEIVGEILNECGITVPLERIISFAEFERMKKDKELSKDLSGEYQNPKHYIYITSNCLEKNKRLGIDIFFIMSTNDMLQNSSLNEIFNKVCDIEDSLIIGIIISKLFNDPFILGENCGEVYFNSCFDWGFCVWGNIVFTFIQWLIKKSKENEIKRFLFLARDGYLLKEDYDFYRSLANEIDFPESEYLYTSRRIAFVSTINSKEDYESWCAFPYNGLFGEYLKDRFFTSPNKNDMNANVLIQLPDDMKKVRTYILPYKKEIANELDGEKRNYIDYLKKIDITDKDAVVDTGYYGNIQDRLNRILGQKLQGLYFTCFLDKSNECSKNNIMIPCFQAEADLCAKNSKLREKTQLVESMFTAPYGMIVKVDECGEGVSAPSGKNQENFSSRLEVNEGVKEFINEVFKIKNLLSPSAFSNKGVFADKIYGMILESSELEEKISSCFMWDDNLVQRRENSIFL